MDEEAGQRWVKATIQSHMAKRALTYADLCVRLRAIGIEENERNLRNKVARGTFSAVFFMVCLEALGVRDLHIDILPASLRSEIERDDQTLANLRKVARGVPEVRQLLRDHGIEMGDED